MNGAVMPKIASVPRWYVIQTKPRQEYRALEHLERQGFSCYLPTLAVERIRNARRIEVEEPLFPSYLFIRLDDVNDNWLPIRSTRGVSHIVRFNEYPLPVNDEIIDAIQQRLETDQPRVRYLQPGERVRITEGCFADVEAVFVAADGEQRVILLMKILQREQMVSFPAGSVRKCQGV